MRDLEYEMGVFLRGRQFKKLVARMSAESRAKYGLKQIELDILAFLARTGEATATQIHHTLGLNKGHVSQALASLCAKNYVRLRAMPFDRRAIAIQLTDQAAPVVESIRLERKQIMEQVLKGFTQEELDRMRSATDRILANIRGLITE